MSKVGGGMFCLIRVAMLRAMEIHAGKPPLVDHHHLDKATTIALKEIAQGKVVYKNKESKPEKEKEKEKNVKVFAA